MIPVVCQRCHDRGGYYDGMFNGGAFAIRCECGAPTNPRNHFKFEDPAAFAARQAERERSRAEVEALFADGWERDDRTGSQLELFA